MSAAKERQAQLAKPPGSLGVLEELSIKVAGMTGKIHNKAEKCRIVVLCADNGVCDEGVSCTPQSVTLSQTINLTRGMTGASSLAKHFGDEIVVVDVGVMSDYNCPEVINRKIAYGTKNLYLEPAMTREEAEKAICVGLEMADKCAEDGVDAIGVGEMGIGNTTTSAAVLSAFTKTPAEITAGKGGGLLDEAYLHKIEVINGAIAKHNPDISDPIDVLSKVGGLDIAAMCGVFLGAAEHLLDLSEIHSHRLFADDVLFIIHHKHRAGYVPRVRHGNICGIYHVGLSHFFIAVKAHGNTEFIPEFLCIFLCS